jgi:glycosyltransferase involved in cell wall biosynthesis
MIAPQPFLEPRGTPISVYQRLHGLSSLGHSVDLVTYHIGEDVSLPGVNIFRIPKVPFIRELKVGPSWAKVPLDIFLFFKTLELLIRNRYDVIHAHEEAAVFGALFTGIFRTPHLYDMHSSLPRQLVNFNFGDNRLVIKFFELLERWVIHSCDALITIGSDLETHAKEIKPGVNEIMIENLPLQRKQTSNLPGVSELKTRLGIHDKRIIVYTGTFERYQGVGLLIQSAEIVRKRHADIAFVLVGGKPHQIAEMQEETRKRRLEDCVLFTGTVPIDESNQYIEMADILVSPRTEGTSVPLKIYTYLHAAKPIVATNLIAHTLVLNDETAVLVDPAPEALAEGILQVIGNPELRKEISTQAHRLAEEKYSQAAYLKKLEKIYCSIHPAAQTREQALHSMDH